MTLHICTTDVVSCNLKWKYNFEQKHLDQVHSKHQAHLDSMGYGRWNREKKNLLEGSSHSFSTYQSKFAQNLSLQNKWWFVLISLARGLQGTQVQIQALVLELNSCSWKKLSIFRSASSEVHNFFLLEHTKNKITSPPARLGVLWWPSDCGNIFWAAGPRCVLPWHKDASSPLCTDLQHCKQK